MDKKCGCWSVLKRGVRGACKSSASKDSANTIPRTSLVYDAGTYTYKYMSVFYNKALLLYFGTQFQRFILYFLSYEI
jgi:hypothetical protein